MVAIVGVPTTGDAHYRSWGEKNHLSSHLQFLNFVLSLDTPRPAAKGCYCFCRRMSPALHWNVACNVNGALELVKIYTWHFMNQFQR